MPSQADLAKMFESGHVQAAGPSQEDLARAFDAGRVEDHTQEGPGMLESGARGLAQGATLGFADELTGGAEALKDAIADPKTDVLDAYRKHRDESRALYEAAKAAHPEIYTPAELAGGVTTGLLVPGAGTLGGAMALGAAGGLGYGDADVTKGQLAGAATDALVGGTLGAAAHGAGSLIQKGLGAVAGKAGEKVAAGEAKAAQMAADNQATRVATAQGELGAATQSGNRYVENLLRLQASGDMTQGQQAMLQRLKDAGVLPQLNQKLADSMLEKVPQAAENIAGKQQALTGLLDNAGALQQADTEQLLKPTGWQDLKSFAKSYAEPFVGGAAAQAVGLPPHVGATIMARTRAAGSALRKVNKPGNQVAFWGAVKQAATYAPDTLGKWGGILQRAANRSENSLGATHWVLSQTDPAYREHIATLEEQSTDAQENQ